LLKKTNTDRYIKTVLRAISKNSFSKEQELRLNKRKKQLEEDKENRVERIQGKLFF
jgi:hypothetical protein